MHNCALAAGHISHIVEILLGSLADLNSGLLHIANNYLSPILACHRNPYATAPWTKIQVRMAYPKGWRRFEHLWFEWRKGCVPGTGYQFTFWWYFLWSWNTCMVWTTVHSHQGTLQMTLKYSLDARCGFGPRASRTLATIASRPNSPAYSPSLGCKYWSAFNIPTWLICAALLGWNRRKGSLKWP